MRKPASHLLDRLPKLIRTTGISVLNLLHATLGPAILEEPFWYILRPQTPKSILLREDLLSVAIRKEKTASAFRFEVKLTPDATEKFPVTEERVYESAFSIANLTPDVLVTYIRNKNLSDAGRKQLSEMADRKQQMAENNAAIQRTEAGINGIARDQDRIRQNINSLNQVSGQQERVQKYARRLADQESQLAALRDRQSEFERTRAALQSELNSLIEKIDF